ncbi:MAG: hypothetical protein ACRDBG_00815 [Waterburya sp.]
MSQVERKILERDYESLPTDTRVAYNDTIILFRLCKHKLELMGFNNPTYEQISDMVKIVIEQSKTNKL